MRYTGKDVDPDTGLYYFNARWHDAGTGRFISEDPILDGTLWFAYVANNPMTLVDPTGLRMEEDVGDGRTYDAERDTYYNSDGSVSSNQSDTALGDDNILPDIPLTAIDQREFERRYGFGNGITPAASCQTATWVNAYIALGHGITTELLDAIVPGLTKAGAILPDGSVGDDVAINRALAERLGRDDYLRFIYDFPGGIMRTATEETFAAKSPTGLGIAQLENSVGNHYVLYTLTQTVDPLDYRRGHAPYELNYIAPLQLWPLRGPQ
jgi:RHS repeat-associated protein